MECSALPSPGLNGVLSKKRSLYLMQKIQLLITKFFPKNYCIVEFLDKI